jgi:hypothetical protein
MSRMIWALSRFMWVLVAGSWVLKGERKSLRFSLIRLRIRGGIGRLFFGMFFILIARSFAVLIISCPLFYLSIDFYGALSACFCYSSKVKWSRLID